MSMNNNDKNFYIDSLEQENEKLRRDLKNLREDMRDLAFDRFHFEKELQRATDGLDLSSKADSVSVHTSSSQQNFLSDVTTIGITIHLVDESSNSKLPFLVDAFREYIKENGIFKIRPDKINLK